ncbi:hypothetical protein [Parasitella parasitica]|uniref:Uncharacterized protein n=1 Tax=Parasitella parasitica TaxID=35722 RepID=A0A0B7MRN8_9FUNG|nr:hypothetical protein [Parasitella parasitica]
MVDTFGIAGDVGEISGIQILPHKISLPIDVNNSGLYVPKSLSFSEIFSEILKMTNVHDDKTINGFTKWRSHKKLKLVYEDNPKKMKEAGYEVIRYARKSKDRWHKSVCQSKFVSSDSLNKRDEKKRKELISHIIANGDTQDMLRSITDKEEKIMLVAIDYAGLTTNCEDMRSFLSTDSSIEEIAIYLILSQNKARVFTTIGPRIST